VVKQQQFGDISDEQQLSIIKAKTPEAKTTKAQETFILLGRFISSKCLPLFIEPMKDVSFDRRLVNTNII
jgi:hypothetical protein